MTCWRVCAVALVGCCMAGPPSVARASVDLEFRPAAVSSSSGDPLEVGLYAVANGGVSESVSAMDVVLTWDPNVVELEQAINNGPGSWGFMFGLVPDSQLDGLNDSLADGDALFQALSSLGGSGVSVSPSGTLVVTLRFRALALGGTTLTIEPALGRFSRTQVLATGNVDITGRLGTADLRVTGATLSVLDLTLPAGRVAPLIVSGAANADLFGVTVAVEIVARAGDTGVTRFTPASGPADVDIFLLNDPWPIAGGLFEAFDTNITGSETFNGGIMDNGTFIGEPTVFSGPLMSFGVAATSDARGVWDVVFDGETARWESRILQPVGLVAGTITVVALGDGNGSETVELGDFAELAACFTGDVGPIDPPAFSTTAGSRCAVYDMDDDGDVDGSDYAAFMGLLGGP